MQNCFNWNCFNNKNALEQILLLKKNHWKRFYSKKALQINFYYKNASEIILQ